MMKNWIWVRGSILNIPRCLIKPRQKFRFSSVEGDHPKHRKGQTLKLYMELSRIKRPSGVWLLYAPCAWSIQMGTYSAILNNISTTSLMTSLDPLLLGTFLVGSTVMRTAGCIINDMWDTSIDRQVTRTKDRPLAAGTLTRRQALGMLSMCLAGGLAVLCQLPMPCVLLGMASMGPVVIYPLMKRITFFPQAMLGVAFSWGALLGMPAVLMSVPSFSGSLLDMAPVICPLYVSGIFWTLVYDTIYAHQDVSDDIRVGVKSTAIKFGTNTDRVLSFLSTLVIGFLDVAGMNNGQSLLYFSVINGGLFPFLLWQANFTNFSCPKDCSRMFSRSSYFGLIVFMAIFVDSLYLINEKSKHPKS